MSVLTMVWIHVYSKRKNKLAQVQQLTNEVYGAKKPRMSWTSVIQEKFAESVLELGGIDSMNLFHNLGNTNLLFSHSSNLGVIWYQCLNNDFQYLNNKNISDTYLYNTQICIFTVLKTE